MPGKLFIEGFEDGWRAERQIRGVFDDGPGNQTSLAAMTNAGAARDLHETPVVGLGEDVEHRTALLGIVIGGCDAGGRTRWCHRPGPRCPWRLMPYLYPPNTEVTLSAIYTHHHRGRPRTDAALIPCHSAPVSSNCHLCTMSAGNRLKPGANLLGKRRDSVGVAGLYTPVQVQSVAKFAR